MREDWTEKYRPDSLADIVGNDGAVRAMRRWAESWQKGSPRRKAMVLRGEPGIGKTSAALALARDMGWDVIEMNASDHRNAEAIRRIAGAGAISQTFSSEGEFLTTAEGRRKLIVLDEADNLFGREDYGGARAIVETIKETSQPMILIVNDYYALSRKASAVKSLAESVIFRRLDDRSIGLVLERISSKENVLVDPDVIDRISSNAGGDMRGAINDLQMLVEGRTNVRQEDADALGKRNQEIELDSSLRNMFGAETAAEARNATFGVDKTPEELVIWIEENIPLEFHSPEELAEAFDSLSRSDIYLRRARALQHYGLWAYAKEMMTSGVAMSRRSPRARAPYRYNFPSYLMAMSRSRSIRAARASLCAKLSPLFHTSSRRVSNSILPFLRSLGARDRKLLIEVGAEADLDEGDIAFILAEDPGSDTVSEIATEIKKLRGEVEVTPSKRPKGRGRKKESLADFQ